MNIWSITLLITCLEITLDAQRCSRPTLSRKQIFIYRTMGTVNVKIYRCLYNDTRNAYSDISNHCLTAFRTGKFLDKWDQSYNLRSRNSPIVLEEYVAKADPLRNRIMLRSGTVCRYDRGFCYDPIETLSYAAVWETIPISHEKCPTRLEQVFYGHVDLWTFAQEKLLYVFFYDIFSDRSFAIRLANSSSCHNRPVWYTTEKGYIVSLYSLIQNYQPTKKLNENYFPLSSKKLVTEAVLKDCDLRAYSMDFDDQLPSDYFVDPENLRIIFSLYQKHIKDNEKAIERANGNFNKVRSVLQSKNKEMNDVKIVLGLYKIQFEKINKSLNELLKKSNQTTTSDNGDDFYIKLSSTDDDLYTKIKKLDEDFNKLENYFKNVVLDNNKNMEEIENNFLALKGDQYFLSLLKNISYSIEIDINNIKNFYPEIEGTVFKQLQPVITALEVNKNSCNEETQNLNKTFNKLLNSLKLESIHSNKLIENNIYKYIDNANKKLEGKINSTNTELHYLEKQLREFTFYNEGNIQSIKENLENLTKTLNLTFNNSQNQISLLGDDLQYKYNSLHKLVNNKSKICENEIQTLKDYTIKEQNSIKQEIFQTYIFNSLNHSKELTNVNTTLVKRIDASDTKIKELDRKLEICTFNSNKNSGELDDTIKNLTKNLADTNTKLNEAPKKMEENISTKFTQLLNSLENKCSSCNIVIEDFKQQTNLNIDNLKTDLTQICKRGDQVLFEQFENGKNDLSRKIAHTDSKLIDFENEIHVCNRAVDHNKELTKNEINDIKNNLTSIHKSINLASSVIDKNLEEKYNKIMVTLNDKGNECMRAIDNIQHNIDETVKDVKENIFNSLTKKDDDITADFGNLKIFLLKQLESLHKQTEELKVKLDNNKQNNARNEAQIKDIKENITTTYQTLDNIPSKIENNILQKFNSKMQELSAKTMDCGKEIKDLKNNFEKEVGELRDETFKKISAADQNYVKTFEKLDTSFQEVEKLNAKIDDLEKKAFSKTGKTPQDTKIEFLIKETSSLYSRLHENIDNVTQTKDVLEQLRHRFDQHELNVFTKDSKFYEFLNQSIINHGYTLENLKTELDDIKNFKNKFSSDVEKQMFQLTADTKTNSDDIKFLQEQLEEKSKKEFDQLKTENENNQKLLKKYEQEIQQLRNDLSLKDKRLDNNDNVIKDLKKEIEDIRKVYEKNEVMFATTILNVHSLIDKKDNETLELKNELNALKECCNNNRQQMEEKDKEIKQMKTELRSEIEKLKQEVQGNFGGFPDTV